MNKKHFSERVDNIAGALISSYNKFIRFRLQRKAIKTHNKVRTWRRSPSLSKKEKELLNQVEDILWDFDTCIRQPK